ncbi:hypothetical protein EMCRGX_G000130 [Ephydatia muelleri]
MKYYFVVVKDLITPVILGVDILQDKGLVLDFTTTPLTVTPRKERSTRNQQKSHYISLELAPALKAEKQRRSKFCAALSVYQETLQAKLVELQDLVEAHIVETAKHHKVEEDVNSGVQYIQRVDNVQWEALLIEHFYFGSQPPVANPPTLPPQPVQPEPPAPTPSTRAARHNGTDHQEVS